MDEQGDPAPLPIILRGEDVPQESQPEDVLRLVFERVRDTPRLRQDLRRPQARGIVLEDNTVYLAGGKQMPQWCRNIRVNAPVTVDIDGTTLHGDAHLVDDTTDGAAVIDRFLRKYLLARLSRPFGGYRRSVPVIVHLGSTPPSA